MKRFYGKLKYAIVIFFSVFLGCFMLISNRLAEKSRSVNSDYTTGWTTGSGEKVDSDNIRIDSHEEGITISHTLPDRIGLNDGLCFVSNNISFTVYVDGAAIYDYYPEKNLTGSGYGIAYHTISLCEEQAGKNVEIEMRYVFDKGRGGQIRMISVENMFKYRKRLATGQLVSFNISVGVMIMGLLLLLFGLFIQRKEKQPDISALGLTALCAGIWLANDTGFLRLIFDAVIFSRVIDYLFMLLWILPFVEFIYSVTRERRAIYRNIAFAIYTAGIAIIIVACFVFGLEMSQVLTYVLLFFASICILTAFMIISDIKYRRANNQESDLKLYFFSLAIMTASLTVDYLIYMFGVRSVTGRGYFSRVGFCIMVVMMGMEALDEYTRERASIKRDRFINKMLQYAVSTNDPDTNIRAIIEYFGREFNAEHTFIYENRHDGTFHNTYEWFGENAPQPLYLNYHDIPFEGLIDKLQEAFARDHRVIIDDSEQTRLIAPNLYELFKKVDIKNMVVGPLEYDGDLIGLFGVDDAPKEASEEIADIIWLMSYFVSQLLVQRNEKRNLVRYSYFDSLTGTKNRRALEEYEATASGNYPYGYVMCDINGLKYENDNLGHDAGDKLIIDIADSLKEAFGEANVYRVGGDEFAAYVFPSNKEELDKMVASARELIAARNRSASIGAVFAADGSVPHDKIKEEADKLMYDEKEIYYQGRNDRRR